MFKFFTKELVAGSFWEHRQRFAAIFVDVAKWAGDQVPSAISVYIRICAAKLDDPSLSIDLSELTEAQQLFFTDSKFYKDFMTARKQALLARVKSSTDMPTDQRTAIAERLLPQTSGVEKVELQTMLTVWGNLSMKAKSDYVISTVRVLDILKVWDPMSEMTRFELFHPGFNTRSVSVDEMVAAFQVLRSHQVDATWKVLDNPVVCSLYMMFDQMANYVKVNSFLKPFCDQIFGELLAWKVGCAYSAKPAPPCEVGEVKYDLAMTCIVTMLDENIGKKWNAGANLKTSSCLALAAQVKAAMTHAAATAADVTGVSADGAKSHRKRKEEKNEGKKEDKTDDKKKDHKEGKGGTRSTSRHPSGRRKMTQKQPSGPRRMTPNQSSWSWV